MFVKKISSKVLAGICVLSFAAFPAAGAVAMGIKNSSAEPMRVFEVSKLEAQIFTTANYEQPGLNRGSYSAGYSSEYLTELKAKEQKAKLEVQRKAAERSSRSSHSAPSYAGGGSKDDWLKDSGIAESDWGYVDYIVRKESGWNPNAVNSSSGASGLVQALPCGKVPGSCFNPVDNLKWADGYAKGRYGSWSQAYGFWRANSWW